MIHFNKLVIELFKTVKNYTGKCKCYDRKLEMVQCCYNNELT